MMVSKKTPGETTKEACKSMLIPKSYIATLVYGLTLFVVVSLTAHKVNAKEVATVPELVSMLKQGGYIIYLRHGATDHAQNDQDLSDLRECSLQRNLNKQGKKESRLLGAAFEKLGVKIDKVLSSPYCRCVDTALFAFNRVEIDMNMRATFATNEAETQVLKSYLTQQLQIPPKAKHNRVLVGHTANLREVTKVWPKPEGVMHIFKPTPQGYEHMGRIPPSQWDELVK